MGGDNRQADPDEYPKHEVEISSFWMNTTEITNRQFSNFVKATGYQTTAEQPIDWEELAFQLPPETPKPPDSVLLPGALVFNPTQGPVNLNNPANWWEWTIGADWNHPEGPGSDILDKMDHPVVQVSWEDANAYCKWSEMRLPTEAEWEWAARGGLDDMIYPWGNESVEEGNPKANFYQGDFPYNNLNKDGFISTAPVKSFLPNGYGLYDMAGNVWEWCEDWYRHDYYSLGHNQPEGPNDSFDPQQPFTPQRVIRGGSFLCNDTYCSGYRNARRMKSSPDSGLNHTGFRCVKNEPN